MKKLIILFLMTLIIIVFQQALFSKLLIFGIAFDAVLVYIVCISTQRENYECLGIALITGILRDSFFPSAFGINTIVYLITAYAISYFEQRMYRNSMLIPIFFTFVFSILKGILYYGYLYIISIKYDFSSYALQVILAESILNAIISIPLFGIVKKICNTEVMKKEWKF